MERAEFELRCGFVGTADELGVSRIDHELACLKIVAPRHAPTHPQSLRLQAANLSRMRSTRFFTYVSVSPKFRHHLCDQAETSVLFELIAERYERKSIAVTANQPFSVRDQPFPMQR